MKKIWRSICSASLAALLLLGGAAAEELTPQGAEPVSAPLQEPAPWAYGYIADAYSLKLLDDGYGAYITSPVTLEQVEALAATAAEKLALLGLAPREGSGESLPLDTTRGGVVNALYQELAAYDLPQAGLTPAEALRALKVLRGDGTGLALERTCTYQEAMVMTTRLILAVYDSQDAGSRGLLWKAVNGDTTLYLLGTAHMDRSNVYPFHKTLREAIASANEVILELDFNDQEGLAQFAAMQTYTDGTSLSDHISESLFAQTAQVFAALGMPEEQVAAYKPWALANTLMSLSTQDETAAGAPMAMDLYLSAAAVSTGKKTGAVETYALQGGIFDTLSPEYQEAYLAAYVSMALADESDRTEEERKQLQEAMELQQQGLDAIMEAWKTGDTAAFETIYGKSAIVDSDDELNSRLFTDRDPNMIRYAADLLEREGENTFLMAVGAGHMVDPGGIVSGLRALGYQVEPMG